MRIYVPATWPMLRTLVKTGVLDPIGGTAFALTPGLREAYTSGDDDELEYAAMSHAARASLRLLSVEFGLGEDSTPARPCMRSITRRTIARPMPVPGYSSTL